MATRYREPVVGDRVWVEGMKPNPNLTIRKIDYHYEEVYCRQDDTDFQHTLDLSAFGNEGLWTDKLGGVWLFYSRD